VSAVGSAFFLLLGIHIVGDEEAGLSFRETASARTPPAPTARGVTKITTCLADGVVAAAS
jgi:hypothetical protein